MSHAQLNLHNVVSVTTQTDFFPENEFLTTTLEVKDSDGATFTLKLFHNRGLLVIDQTEPSTCLP